MRYRLKSKSQGGQAGGQADESPEITLGEWHILKALAGGQVCQRAQRDPKRQACRPARIVQRAADKIAGKRVYHLYPA